MMALNGSPLRRNACQMFGIYRSRTPDKMAELKPNRQTRACFLTAVIAAVALVVGLSLLDVSTNAANIKSTPVLHLTRHRQDLISDKKENRNVNLDEDAVVGHVREITKPPNKTESNYKDVTATIATSETTQSKTKNYSSNRQARTKLHTIDKIDGSHTVKEYIIDGRHDPKSLGYYKLQKENGEYYLQNYSEPVWGTRIQRRFSNRVYSKNQDYHKKKYNVGSTQYIKRNDYVDYRVNKRRIDKKIKQNLDVKQTEENSYHLAPFRRLTSTLKLDTINDRIQNSEKENKNDLVANENQLSVPPYDFTPIPIFSESYAQLDPYRNNAHIKSVHGIMKYLTVSPKFNRPRTTTIPTTIASDNVQAETALNQKEITNSRSNSSVNQNNTKKRKKGIRFTGTYKMPIEPEDLNAGSSSLFETLIPPPLTPPIAKPYSSRPNGFKEQTDMKDPFANFRPSDPSEINHLLSPPYFNNKNKQIGSMFINNIRTSTVPPNRYFPRPPFEIKKHPRPSNEVNSSFNRNVTPSSSGHTVAIFKPQNDNIHHSNNQYVKDNKKPPYQTIVRKRKPVSVLLDIYPMHVEEEDDDEDQNHSPTNNKNNNKGNNIHSSSGDPRNKEGQLEWITPTESSLSNDDEETADQVDSSPSGSDSHMVVHLNVYPKGITRKPRAGSGRRPIWNTPATPRAMLMQKSEGEVVNYPTKYENYRIASNINDEEEARNEDNPKFIEYLDYDFKEENEDEMPISFYDDSRYHWQIKDLLDNLKNNSPPKSLKHVLDVINTISNSTNENIHSRNNKSNARDVINNSKVDNAKEVNSSRNKTNQRNKMDAKRTDYRLLKNKTLIDEIGNPPYSLPPRNQSLIDTEGTNDYIPDYPIEYY